MTNSLFFEVQQYSIVVNCFQISNFVLWQTALVKVLTDKAELWIAFKLVILSYDKQHDFAPFLSNFGCELLSN